MGKVRSKTLSKNECLFQGKVRMSKLGQAIQLPAENNPSTNDKRGGAAILESITAQFLSSLL